MKISIFGLGYVGLTSSACFAEMGHTVVGVDIAEDKVNAVNGKQSPINEEGLQATLQNHVSSGALTATTRHDEAIEQTELSIICVGTPNIGQKQDLRSIENVSRQIGEALSENGEDHTVILRSTVLPGTSENVVRWLNNEGSDQGSTPSIQYIYQPEFLREGTAMSDFFDPPFIVAGSDQPNVRPLLEELYPDVDADVHITSIREAEFIKYACNAFHALKIGFANEIGRLSKEMEIDGRNVMNLVKRDKKLNISEKYLAPGSAFGGSCLPKDLQAITQFGEEHDVETPILNHILISNRTHIEQAKELIAQTDHPSWGVLGLGFKQGTDDLRNSPVLELCRHLQERDLSFSIHDPYIEPEKLHGRNRVFLEQTIPDYQEQLISDRTDLLEQHEAVLIGTNEDSFRDTLLEQSTRSLTVLDLPGLFEPDEVPDPWTYEGLCW